MDASDAGAVTSLLEDEAFRALLRRAQDDWLSWDDFLTMRLPAATSPLEAWHLLQTLRRSVALEFPNTEAHGLTAWYTRTARMDALLSVIDRECGAHSELYLALANAKGRPFAVRARVEDAIAAARIDGLEVGAETANRLLRMRRSPRTPAEMLLRNSVLAMQRLGDYIDELFTPAFLHELRRLLLQDIEPGSLPSDTPSRRTLHLEDSPYSKRLSADERAEGVCAYANDETGEPHEHRAVRALMLAHTVRATAILPDVNHQVGRLVFHLYCLKHDMPVLGMLPLNRARLMWERGELVPEAMASRPGRGVFPEGHEFDATGAVTLELILAVHELERLKRDVHEAERRDREILAALSQDARFNVRQRRVIGRALGDPHAEFRIGDHRADHNVTYATARKDLVGLASAGYLERRSQGRAFVFVPARGLAGKVRQAHG